MNTNKEKIIRTLMVAAAIVLGIKYILTDFGIDAGFQLTMSYRLATGDVMLKEMWEPYQMSAFLCAPLIALWLAIFRTTTGLVLYLQTAGVLVDAAVSCLFYSRIKKHFPEMERAAFLMAWIFFVVSPKDVPIPEYANLQLWLTLLLCLCLLEYHFTEKRRFIVLGAFCMCGIVLAYPSCALIFIATMVILVKHGRKSDAGLFAGLCFGIGGIYAALLLRNVGISGLITVLHGMFALETSHGMKLSEKFLWYAGDAAKIAVGLLIAYLVSFLLTRIPAIKKRLPAEALFLVFIIGFALYTTLCWSRFVRFNYAVLFPALILLGLLHAKKLDEKERFFYGMATLFSLLNFFATLLLTNLVLCASLPYLLVGAVAALLPISKAANTLPDRKTKTPVAAAALILIAFMFFRNAYLIRPLAGDVFSIFQLHGIVKAGPAAGVITEYMGAYIQNESVKEWEQYVPDGSNIYIVGPSTDTLGYLYKNTGVSAPSLVPTPDYNDSLFTYWEMNPDKYPDIVIVSCWYGTLNVEEDSWIMNWIKNDFSYSSSVDGKYWRYYFR